MKHRPFLALWTLAVIATVAAFVLHLGLRGRTVDLGYKLGRARAEQARLREQKRVLSLEAASYETPQRVEMVARTLLGMNPPPPERVIPLKPIAPLLPPEEGGSDGDADQPAPKPAASASATATAPFAPFVQPNAPVDPAGAPAAAPIAPGAPGAPAVPGLPVANDGLAPSGVPTDLPAALPMDPAGSQGAAP